MILHGLFAWLISTGYTTVNPFADVHIQAAALPVAGSTQLADNCCPSIINTAPRKPRWRN